MISSMEEYSHNGPIEDYHVTLSEITSFLRMAISRVNDDIYDYSSLTMGENDSETYILLVGWSYGFDEDDPDTIDGYGLCVKLCIDSDMIGSEFDDFNMPYTLNGDVWDTCCEISRDPTSPSIESDAEWLLKEWKAFYNAYMDSEEFLNPEYLDDSDEEDDFDDEE